MKIIERKSIVPAAALAAACMACAPGGHASGDASESAAATAATAAASIEGSIPGARVVTVTATDYAFQAPDSIPAGLTTIRLIDKGHELHHAQLVRIAEGHTLEELVQRIKAGELSPAWATYVGGPNTPAPGGESEATLDLTPGQYALICIIPSPDGVPHLMKGMMHPITVTPARTANSAEPEAGVRMRLTDYAFPLSSDIGAGRRTIRVENVAAQPHEAVLVQLAPGKRAHDMVEWIEKPHGPPPGKPIGGTALLSHGAVDFVTADFAPGRYALLCFVPDARDGKPHVAHGMMREITVH